jgi:hypothetical protein
MDTSISIPFYHKSGPLPTPLGAAEIAIVLVMSQVLARIAHKPRNEEAEMQVMARKTSELAGGVSRRYVEERRARMTPSALADTSPQQRACEYPGLECKT